MAVINGVGSIQDTMNAIRTNVVQSSKAFTTTEEIKTNSSPSFDDVMLKALDGVNETQNTATSLIEQSLIDPDSVETQEITVAMAEANLSLNITRTILDRLVKGWKEVINTR